jgi:hypothetical protein
MDALLWIPFALAVWLGALLLVVALGVAAHRGDELLAIQPRRSPRLRLVPREDLHDVTATLGVWSGQSASGR